MALLSYVNYSSNVARDVAAYSQGQETVYEVFLRHRKVLSDLPGEASQFDQVDFGYEWRCEFEIGSSSPARIWHQAEIAHSWQLHFYLSDFSDRQLKPVAVLHLVERGQEHGNDRRLQFHLKNLTETHAQLNEYLIEREATIEAFEKVNLFIEALAKVKGALGSEVLW